MAKGTRHEPEFTSYDLNDLRKAAPGFLSHCSVHRLAIDFAAQLESAVVEADARASELDAGTAEVDPEWEEADAILSSRPPSPISRSPSPEPPRAESPLDVPTEEDQPGHAATERAGSSKKRAVSAARALSKKERRARRRVTLAEGRPFGAAPRPQHSQGHRELPPKEVAFNAKEAQSAGPGSWVGPRPAKRRKRGRRVVRTLEELLGEGFELIRWEGRDPLLVVDSEDRIILILLGRPEDPEWDGVVADAVSAMIRARTEGEEVGEFTAGDQNHRRGSTYLPIAMGVSLGGGQRRPGNLVHSKKVQRVVDRLVQNKNVRRLLGFQSNGLARYAPKVHADYVDCMGALFDHHPGLVQLFDNSVYPAVTFNCGPESVACEHMDYANKPDGFCAITAGGKFDHEKGGHVYWTQLKVVAQFPSGSSILGLSGSIDHGNTPIQPGETRCSITQYASGALFRWVAYGFQSVKSLLAQEGGAEKKARLDGEPGERARKGLARFSKRSELASDRAAVFGL